MQRTSIFKKSLPIYRQVSLVLIFGLTTLHATVHADDVRSEPQKIFYSIEQAKEAIALADDKITEEILREKRLYDQIVSLRTKFESKNDFISEQEYQKKRKGLVELLDYQSVSYIPMTDAGREQFVPAYQIAASAKATLIHWNIGNYSKKATDIIKTDLTELNNYFGTADIKSSSTKFLKSDYYQRILAANQVVDRASLRELQSLKDYVLQQDISLPTLFVLHLAENRGSVQLYKAVLNQYQRDSISGFDSELSRLKIQRALQHLPQTMPESDQLELFNFTLNYSKFHEEFMEATLLGMSEFLDRSTEVKEILHRQLKDKKYGATVALALSKTKDLSVLQQLENNIIGFDKLNESEKNLLKRSLLAVYLIKKNKQSGLADAATEVLERYVALENQSPENLLLKREVEQWLK